MSERTTSIVRAAPAVSAACSPNADGSCALCGDVAVPAMIIAIDAATGIATAVAGGAELSVGLDLVDGVAVGDTVLVHQGFAIARVEAT